MKVTTKRTLATALCGILALTAVAGAGTALYMGAKENGWFEKDTEVEENVDEASGFAVGETQSHGISLSTVAVQGSGTFNSKTYESSATISATVTPSDATDLTLTWSLAWASTSSATISDYVALSSTTSSSGESITVYCYQPFSTQIILTAKADAGLTSDVTATATLDYYKSFTGLDGTNSCFTLTSDPITSTVAYGVDINILGKSDQLKMSALAAPLTFTYGTGTIAEPYSNIAMTFSLSDGALQVLDGYQDLFANVYGMSVKATSYTVDLSDTGLIADYILAGVFGTATSSITKYSSEFYQFLLMCYYEECMPFDLDISVTGLSSGKVSTLSTSFTIDYSGYYTEATSVTLGDTSLYF